MPILGTLVVDRLADRAPVMRALDTESEVLGRAEILQVMFEIGSDDSEAMLPHALHPTIPPTVTWVLWKVTSSALGPFSMAQCRIGCRAGVRPRGFLVGAIVDEGQAAHQLSTRWGYRCLAGQVELVRRYDRVDAVVAQGGGSIFEASLLDPVPISGGDLHYNASMHLAHCERGLQLVQVDPEYTFHRAERGRPILHGFDAAPWGEPRITPVYPVSASYSVADITLPRLRYICDPDVPALEGTQKVG